jgi:hypothetical protein
MKKSIVLLAATPLLLTSCFYDKTETVKDVNTTATTSGEVSLNTPPE